MQETDTYRHDIGGIRITSQDTTNAIALVANNPEMQEALQHKLGRRTATERNIIREIYFITKKNNHIDLWTALQASELLYESKYHLKAMPLAKVKTERQQRKDRRKRNCTDKLKICMLEIHDLKRQDKTWTYIIDYLKHEHRTQFYRETISREYIRHLYYQWRHDTATK